MDWINYEVVLLPVHVLYINLMPIQEQAVFMFGISAIWYSTQMGRQEKSHTYSGTRSCTIWDGTIYDALGYMNGKFPRSGTNIHTNSYHFNFVLTILNLFICVLTSCNIFFCMLTNLN